MNNNVFINDSAVSRYHDCSNNNTNSNRKTFVCEKKIIKTENKVKSPSIS